MPRPIKLMPAAVRMAMANTQRYLNDDWSNAVRQDMFQNDLAIVCAGGCSGFDILLTADRHDRGSNDSGVGRYGGNANGYHQVKQSAAERCGHGDGQQGLRNRQQNIHDSHDDIVNPLAIEAGNRTERAANQKGNANGNETDQQRYACTVNDAAEYIAANSSVPNQCSALGAWN